MTTDELSALPASEVLMVPERTALDKAAAALRSKRHNIVADDEIGALATRPGEVVHPPAQERR